MMSQCWKCLLGVQTFLLDIILQKLFWFPRKQNSILIGKQAEESTFGDDRKAKINAIRSSTSPEVSQEYSIQY